MQKAVFINVSICLLFLIAINTTSVGAQELILHGLEPNGVVLEERDSGRKYINDLGEDDFSKAANVALDRAIRINLDYARKVTGNFEPPAGFVEKFGSGDIERWPGYPSFINTPLSPAEVFDPLAPSAPVNLRACNSPSQVTFSFPEISPDLFPCINWKKLIYWVKPNGDRQAYSNWPQARQDRLNVFFQAIHDDKQDLGLSCPEPTVSRFYMTAIQAEDVYLAHIAHALYLEYTNAVPWKLFRVPDVELEAILSPENYFLPIPKIAGTPKPNYPASIKPGVDYRLPYRQSSASSFICDPRVGYRFMKDATFNLLGDTEEETLIAISVWFRDYVFHGDNEVSLSKKHGLLKDRLKKYKNVNIGQTGFWAIAGCQSAAIMIVDLARAVNIPLLPIGSKQSWPAGDTASHAGLAFHWNRSDARTLVHADHLYADRYDWITLPTVNQRRATSSESDQMFFRSHWRAPADLVKFGFSYQLKKVPNFKKYQLDPTCSSSNFCDITDLGWHIGQWRKGTREDIDDATAAARWNAFFASIENKVMSDGTKCHDETRWINRSHFHPECHREVKTKQAKMNGTFYYYELENGYRFYKMIELGSYEFLEKSCHPTDDKDWAEYVDTLQGHPTYDKRSWQTLRDLAAEMVRINGGCAAVEARRNAIFQKKYSQ